MNDTEFRQNPIRFRPFSFRKLTASMTLRCPMTKDVASEHSRTAATAISRIEVLSVCARHVEGH
jgi:hypothetical protein